MFKEVLKLNNVDYEVKITRKSRVEIEEKEKRNLKNQADDENFIDVMSRIDEFEEIREKLEEVEKMKDGKNKEKKIIEYTKQLLPMTMKAEASGAFEKAIDKYELIYILIHTNPNNPQLSKEEYEKGLFELEEEIGLIELEMKFEEMSNKVFQELEDIKKALSPQKPQKEEIMN